MGTNLLIPQIKKALFKENILTIFLLKNLKKKAIRLAGNYGFRTQNYPDISDHFENIIIPIELKECFDKIKLLDYHHSCAILQRKSYTDSKKNLKDDEIFFEIDFKQKIRIGMSPRQINSEYFKQQLRHLLGIGIYYRRNSKIQSINVNLISDNLGQSGFSVVAAFR